MSLIEQVALVTGAARRVGRAIALALANGGCDVGVHFNQSRQEADETATAIRAFGRRAITVSGDLNDPASWGRMIERTINALGRLDILVNNASLFLVENSDSIESFDPATWENMLRVNLIAPVGLAHHARPFLEKSPNACIVNLCDISAERPWSRHLAYCASKAGLSAITRGLAGALAPKIRVNGVAPGIAVFPEEYDSETRERLIQRVPLKRSGSPAEIASLVRYLAESGQYITGQIIAIDGGRSVAS
jgi:pteridine reductase